MSAPIWQCRAISAATLLGEIQRSSLSENPDLLHPPPIVKQALSLKLSISDLLRENAFFARCACGTAEPEVALSETAGGMVRPGVATR